MTLQKTSRQWLTVALRSRKFWLGLSLAIALFYGLQSLNHAFRRELYIQDDARQHIFWMQQFANPDLFPNDIIAAYFRSVATPGFTAFYHLFAQLGLDPIRLSKLLPCFLGLFTTLYGFGVSWQLFPVPAAAFLSTLLLNQGLWLEDDLASATPRAFLYPLLLAFLYYLLRRSFWAALVCLALLGLFYPQMALLGMAVLTIRLFTWQQGRVRMTPDGDRYRLWGAGLLVLGVILLPYKLNATEFGPLITVAQAKSLAIFRHVDGHHGRAFFFSDNPLVYWLIGPRSGLLFWGLQSPLGLTALALPFLRQRSQQFPAGSKISPQIDLLVHIVLASLGLFLLSHLLLFQLHFPNRYMYHSMRIVLSIGAGISLFVYFHGLFSRYWFSPQRQKKVAIALQLGVVVLLIAAAFSPDLTLRNQLFQSPQSPEIHTFLQQQPVSSLVASLNKEAANVPALAQRSTLVAREFALPYHRDYYEEIRQRVVALTTAQYTTDPSVLNQFIQQYGVDFWLLHVHAFTPKYVMENKLLRDFQVTDIALAGLANPDALVLPQVMGQCTLLGSGGRLLLDANCLQQQLTAPPP